MKGNVHGTVAKANDVGAQHEAERGAAVTRQALQVLAKVQRTHAKVRLRARVAARRLVTATTAAASTAPCFASLATPTPARHGRSLVRAARHAAAREAVGVRVAPQHRHEAALVCEHHGAGPDAADARQQRRDQARRTGAGANLDEPAASPCSHRMAQPRPAASAHARRRAARAVAHVAAGARASTAALQRQWWAKHAKQPPAQHEAGIPRRAAVPRHPVPMKRQVQQLRPLRVTATARVCMAHADGVGAAWGGGGAASAGPQGVCGDREADRQRRLRYGSVHCRRASAAWSLAASGQALEVECQLPVCRQLDGVL